MSKYDEEKEELRRKVELSAALERLSNNADFKKVILKGFCEQEVLELNRQASREMTSEAKLAKSQQSQAGPVLEAFLTRVKNEGDRARDTLPALDALTSDQPEE